MGYLSATGLRQAVQAQCVSDLTGWKRSIYPWDLFPAMGRPLEHKAFAVGVGDTSPYVPEDRQRPTYGTPATIDVTVSYTMRLRADALVSDYDAALTAEAEIIQSAMSTSNAGLMAITFVSAARNVIGEGTVYRGDLVFRCYFRLQLEA